MADDASEWTGFVSAPLKDLRDLVDANKQRLGIGEVRIGEKRKGWISPAMFIYLDPSGGSARAAGRNDAFDWEIPVRMVLMVKDTTESADLEVLEILEKTADLVWNNVSTIGGVHRVQWRNIPQVTPDLVDDEGKYMTLGLLSPTFQKVLQRQR